MHPLVETLELLRYDDGERAVTTDVVLKEARLLIEVDGAPCCRLNCTHSSLEALAVGHLFAEGLIGCYDDVRALVLDGACARVSLHARDKAVRESAAAGGGFRVSARRLLGSAAEFGKKSELFLATGSVHSCALCGASEILCFEEDISRHNALDKVIGYALMRRMSLDECYVLTSGRVPSDMLEKIIRAGIPLVVSRSAPTDVSVRLAKEHGLTLVGFARGARMNVYSRPERIVFDPDL